MRKQLLADLVSSLLFFTLMNTLLTLLVSLTFYGHSGPSSSHDIERPTPSVGVISGGGIQASPLVRYLAATLQLPQERAVVVQQAVQKHQRLTRTPERLAQCLEQVLTPTEFAYYQHLQNRAEIAANLRSLATR